MLADLVQGGQDKATPHVGTAWIDGSGSALPPHAPLTAVSLSFLLAEYLPWPSKGDADHNTGVKHPLSGMERSVPGQNLDARCHCHSGTWQGWRQP